MSSSSLAVLVVPLILALLTWWLDNRVKRAYLISPTEASFFPVSAWIYFIFIAVACMCSLFLVWALDKNQNEGAKEMMLIVGVVGLFGSIIACLWYAKCAVQLTESGLIVITYNGKRTVPLDAIKDIRISNGMIVVDEGGKHRVVIPIIFKDSSLLLANIEARRRRRNLS